MKNQNTFQLTTQGNGYATGKNRIMILTLTSNVAETINITQIPAKSSPDTTESEIYSMKHLNKKHVLQNVDDFDFRSKTANYINQVIPLEKDLIKKYDNARMKAKAFPSDKLLHDEFSMLSSQIEIKLLIKK